jgi:hypothetical protein
MMDHYRIPASDLRVSDMCDIAAMEIITGDNPSVGSVSMTMHTMEDSDPEPLDAAFIVGQIGVFILTSALIAGFAFACGTLLGAP